MRTSRLTTTGVVATLALAPLGGCADPASAPALDAITPSHAPSLARAGGPNGTYVNEVTTPFDVTMRGGTCGLAEDVRLVGEIHHVLEMHPERDGGYGGRWEGTASGLATTASDATYRFRYSNRGRILDARALPTTPTAIRPPRPFSAEVIDRFHLIGQGRAPDVHVTQNFVITFAETGPGIRDIIRYMGDPSCDPI
jgi:hypothetical protein